MADHLRLIHSATMPSARPADERKRVEPLRAEIIRVETKCALRALSSLQHEMRRAGLHYDAEVVASHHDLLADWLGQLLEEMTE